MPGNRTADGVEIDVYEPLASVGEIECYLGIDIGSTSTKATLMNREKEVLVGLYTRTGGQPISAVQKLTAAIAELEQRYSVRFRILAAGTTGSGRKFIQKVVRADYAVDEITAHARAAYHLAPETDTIIEIGGQDAKFTVLKDGSVTFSVMNYVCAAGTGSFIEEQAKRLGVSLQDYAALAMGASAPLISDRCTVFMERDLNHLLSLQYSREELLAAALHSRQGQLSLQSGPRQQDRQPDHLPGGHREELCPGEGIRAEAAETDHRLEILAISPARSASASKWPMPTLAGSPVSEKTSTHEQVEVDEYVCEYCKNHCKIKSIDLEGETLGWGYLCGRDEHDPGYRRKRLPGLICCAATARCSMFPPQPSAATEARGQPVPGIQDGGILSVARRPGFSLARLRNHAPFQSARTAKGAILLRNRLSPTPAGGFCPEDRIAGDPDHGRIPAAVGAVFQAAGVTPVVTSSDPSHITRGKEITGAEYCTPLVEFHGHIRNLLPQVDFIFYPQTLRRRLRERGQKLLLLFPLRGPGRSPHTLTSLAGK